MPGLDGSGPGSGGPMTGGGRGYCSPAGSYEFEGSWSRRGVRFGYGRGRGYRHMFRETGLPRWARRWMDRPGLYRESRNPREDEVKMLKQEAEALKDDLYAIERRMSDLQTEKKPDE